MNSLASELSGELFTARRFVMDCQFFSFAGHKHKDTTGGVHLPVITATCKTNHSGST